MCDLLFATGASRVGAARLAPRARRLTGPGSGVEYRSASARSARAAGARGLSSTTGTPRLTDCGIAMSDGMRNSAVTPSARSTSLMSRCTRAFARFITRWSLLPATESRSRVWMPTLRFLMLGMSRLAISSTSSASSSNASTTSSKCGGMSTTTKSNIVRSIRTMPIISSAVMRSPAAGSTGAHSTRSDDGFVRREEAVHQLRVDRLDDRGRVGRRVLRRYAEQHGVVTELEVGVDRARPGPGSGSRAAPRGSWRRRSCRRHPWWRRRRRSCPAGPARRRGGGPVRRRPTSSRRRARPTGGSGARRRRS